MNGPPSLQSAGALFFVAVAQAEMLQRKEAIGTFERYLAEHPEALRRRQRLHQRRPLRHVGGDRAQAGETTMRR